MFQALIASSPQVPRGDYRWLSLGLHGLVIAGAVALTRHPATAAHSKSPEPKVFFVPPQLAPRPLPATSHVEPSPAAPTAPAWQPSIEAPEISPPALTDASPTVADLIGGTSLRSGATPGLPGIGLSNATPAAPELLTAASVDDPVEVIEQPAPRYPPALAQAGTTGRVELEYVVDTMGRAEPASLRTLVTSHAAFEAAAHATVLASRFRPARLRGKVVRQLVRQTLRFRVGH